MHFHQRDDRLTKQRPDSTDHTENKEDIHSHEANDKEENLFESIVEHFDVVAMEELVPESHNGDDKDAGLLKRRCKHTEENDETREDETVKGEEDMDDDSGREDVVQLKAEGNNPEYVIAGITGVFKRLHDVEVKKTTYGITDDNAQQHNRQQHFRKNYILQSRHFQITGLDENFFLEDLVYVFNRYKNFQSSSQQVTHTGLT